MFRLILRIANAMARAYRFIRDVDYYYSRGHRFRKSIELARDTIYF